MTIASFVQQTLHLSNNFSFLFSSCSSLVDLPIKKAYMYIDMGTVLKYEGTPL